MSFPPEWGCGRAGQSPVVRSCGENAQTHGFRGGWGGPSATHETGLTDCTAGSYLDVRDGWDPFSARPAGRERPPQKTALARANGPSGEVAPGIFPCRKALQTRGLRRPSLRASGRSRIVIRIRDLVLVETHIVMWSIFTVPYAARPHPTPLPRSASPSSSLADRSCSRRTLTSAIPVSSHDPSYNAPYFPSRRFPNVGAGDRVS